MNGIASIRGLSAEPSAAPIGALLQVAALKQQQHVMKEMGQMAVQLIQSAAIIDPAVGRNLDLSA